MERGGARWRDIARGNEERRGDGGVRCAKGGRMDGGGARVVLGNKIYLTVHLVFFAYIFEICTDTVSVRVNS